MINPLLKLNWKEMREKFLSGELLPSEVTKAYLEQMQKMNYLNANITICEDHAMKQAAESDKRYKEGNPRSLEGYPIAVKDLFCTVGVKTTAASKMLDEFVPNYESHVTQCLWDDGAIMLSKTNMDEFAMGAANLYSAFGAVANPCLGKHGKVCVAGGSSGGSASAVSSFQALGGIGSDTGGSARQPAAFCGVVGIRPTYGTCSRYGMIAFASSLDQAGVLSRDVHTAACCLESMMRPDTRDATHAGLPVPKLSDVKPKLSGKKVGIIKSEKALQNADIRSMMEEAEKKMIDAGCEVKHIELKSFDYAIAVYYVFCPSEAASNLARYDGIRYGRAGDSGETYHEKCMSARSNFGDEVKRRILLGTYLLSSEHYDRYYTQAAKVRQWMIDEMNEHFKDVDVFVCPTTIHPAFPLDAKFSPEELYYEDYFTAPVNLSAACALSLPFGRDKEDMPLGLQIIAPAFQEELLISVGLGLEELSSYKHSDEFISEDSVSNFMNK